MYPKKYLLALEQVMTECGIAFRLVSGEGDDPIRVLVGLADLGRIETVWCRLVQLLSTDATTSGVASIPFVAGSDCCAIWINELTIIFMINEDEVSTVLSRPEVIKPVVIAIGGGSCSGKTSTANKLKQLMPGKVVTYPAYTTRPRRPTEIEGLEYYFKTDADLVEARTQSRFAGFVEARGYWYWSDTSAQLKGVWEAPNSVHLFLISQPEAFLKKRALFPSLKWVWLEVSDEVLKQRLLKNPDRNFDSSMEYNARLRMQDRTGLVDLVINNDYARVDEVAIKIRDFTVTLLGGHRV